ncbi:protein NipSnap homolog 3B-like isoform X1 [Lissotriton helveticus]
MLAPRAQMYASVSSEQQQENSEIYELRTYDVKPGKLDDYIKTCIAGVHLRLVHSEMIGFWTVETGGLNKVFHLWKYDSFEHRKRVNTALLQEKAWQDVVSTLVTFLDKMDVETAYIMPWSQLGKPAEKGGVYELVSYKMKPGGPELWGEALKSFINSQVCPGYAKLIGVFQTEYGLLDRVHVLWWHKDPDRRAAGKRVAQKDPQVEAAVREFTRCLVSRKNMLLIPASFSPLQ